MPAEVELKRGRTVAEITMAVEMIMAMVLEGGLERMRKCLLLTGNILIH